jgi:tRNA A37 threonylcarbamoyladenosine dehydratase
MDRAVFQRSELLLGPAAIDRLATTRVILFGLGGVGGWAAEALVRSGVGHLTLVDSDCICITNVNRQIQATPASVGRLKADVLAARLREINPDAGIVTRIEPFGLETQDAFALETYDYVLDAIDSLSPKLGLILQALRQGRTLFSAMGASSRLDPTQVRTGSIWKTARCPLARRIRKRLRHHDFTGDFQVVYSEEDPLPPGPGGACGTGDCLCPRFALTPDGGRLPAHEWCSSKAAINGSLVTVTATFGMCLASLVIRNVAGKASR